MMWNTEKRGSARLAKMALVMMLALMTAVLSGSLIGRAYADEGKVAAGMKDPSTGENYVVMSNPVEIVEAEGFSVQLSYDPPLAGDVAVFQSSIIDTVGDVDTSKLEYIWEMSEDNGKTWTPLAKKYQGKPTLNIQTEPIDSNDNSSSADANLIYIRVRVVETTGQKRVRISNEQPLTVHVGEEAGKGDQKKSIAQPAKCIVMRQTVITAPKGITKLVGCKAFKVKAKASSGAKLTFSSSNPKVATVDKSTGKVTVKKAGTTKIMIKAAAKGNYSSATEAVVLKVCKKNPLKAKAKAITVESGKKTKVKRADAFKVKRPKGKVTFKKLKGNRKIVVTKKGAVKTKPGLEAGKTYRVRVKVTAAGNKTFTKKSKIVVLKVRAV